MLVLEGLIAVFSSSHVWMWKLEYKESWAPKDWCFLSVLEKILESHLGSKKIKPVNPKGNQSWIFLGRTDAEANIPIIWLPDVMSQLIRKDPEARKDWGQEEKRVTEDEVNEWHHWLSGQSLSKLQETVKDREVWRVAVHGVTKGRTRLSNWTETFILSEYNFG